jgi:flagellar motor switch protein FliG
VADAAIAEFHARTRAGRSRARGGRDAAASLLELSFGQEKAAGLLDRATTAVGGSPFEFLEGADPAVLAHQLESELVPTIAMVLAHLSADQGSAVFGGFDIAVRADIAQSIASMRIPDPATVETVAESLRSMSRSSSKATPREQPGISGGVQPLVAIISRSDVSAEHDLLDALDALDPALATEVRSQMLGFADIVKLEARDVQQVIRGIDATVLAIAIKTAAPEITEVIRTNMSERNRELLDTELELVGKLRKNQIIEAQAPVVKAMRELAAQGHLLMRSEGEGEDEDVA